MLVKSLENTKCEATQENLDKLLSINKIADVNIKNALIYDAYFYIKEGKILWGHKKCINPEFWDSLDTIHLVNGQFHYTEEIVIKEKPKNNFEEYGFEADFEGEICFLNEEDNYYIGYVIRSGKKILIQWSKRGFAYNSNDFNVEIYDLKPIKKEWYENPDNFPCIIISLKTNKPHIAYTYNHLEEKIKQEQFSSSPDKFRPATKEEVLSLLVKEE